MAEIEQAFQTLCDITTADFQMCGSLQIVYVASSESEQNFKIYSYVGALTDDIWVSIVCNGE